MNTEIGQKSWVPSGPTAGLDWSVIEDPGSLWASPFLTSVPKRVFDLVVAIGVGLLLLPSLLVLGLAVRLETPGPAIFRQLRSGLGGQPFLVWKFRSMGVQPADHFEQAVRGDPRITRLGAWLRRTSIDELPQLYNVICGHMSLVGPRPHPLALDREFEDRVVGYRARNAARPGITGLAQVSGSRGQTEDDAAMGARIGFDLKYISTASFGQDVAIIIKTALIIFVRDEAY
jgi:putative colanic acid biosynthesis UDP-glucose lipid carrier transferase